MFIKNISYIFEVKFKGMTNKEKEYLQSYTDLRYRLLIVALTVVSLWVGIIVLVITGLKSILL